MKSNKPVKENGFKFDISVIITFHAEGLMALPTIRSAEQAKQFAQKKGLRVELIAIVDTPTPDTKIFIESNKKKFSTIYFMKSGDASVARNKGVKMSRGEHISFLDGDDLISDNWLYSAYKTAKNHGNIVVHPEANLYFGDVIYIFRHLEQQELKTYLHLFDINPWTALSFAARSVYLQNPYRKNSIEKNGFGYEDWLWNCETLANRINHVISKGTVHFIRKKRKDSVLAKTDSNNCVIRKSKLANIKPLYRPKNEIIEFNLNDINKTKSTLRKLVQNKLLKVKKFDGLLKEIIIEEVRVELLAPLPIAWGVGDVFAQILTLLHGATPHELIICDRIGKRELNFFKMRTVPTLLVIESKNEEIQYEKFEQLLVVHYPIAHSPSHCTISLKRFLVNFIVQYKPKHIVSVGSRTIDWIYEKHGKVIFNQSTLELKVLRRHLLEKPWPFTGYPHYASQLNRLTFENKKTKQIFEDYHGPQMPKSAPLLLEKIAAQMTIIQNEQR